MITTNVEMFTDGSCKPNPGPGGWGVILRTKNGVEKELYGGELLTTNNRMELMAVIKGLCALKWNCIVKVYTDSQYVQRGISQWIYTWKQKNRLSEHAKKPVANRDLWCALDSLITKHEITWIWIRGHNGHIENERVDVLAYNGLKKTIETQSDFHNSQ
ncbi:MAG: ribonuclease HI [Rhodospirillaceae bacterium]|jgi:ribonuclease HI|nr:ribonuclease HI [Rhodospirillaceae bacterium]